MFKKIILFIVTAASFLGIFLPYFATGMAAQKVYCDSLKTRKLYASDFKELGVEYTPILKSKNSQAHIWPYPYVKELALYLKFINDTCGFGVFAEENIGSQWNIGEYTGDVVTLQEVLKMKSLNERTYNEYLMVLNEPSQTYVDARNAGNFTRFINHSFKPNVVCSGCYYLGHHIAVIRAIKDIKKDEQLFIDYGDAYWQARGIEPAELK